jgi:hypothetical protein
VRLRVKTTPTQGPTAIFGSRGAWNQPYRESIVNSEELPQVPELHSDLFLLMERPEKYSSDQLNQILLTATPEQLAELRHISLKYDLSMDEVCSEILKLIDIKFPHPTYDFSEN